MKLHKLFLILLTTFQFFHANSGNIWYSIGFHFGKNIPNTNRRSKTPYIEATDRNNKLVWLEKDTNSIDGSAIGLDVGFSNNDAVVFGYFRQHLELFGLKMESNFKGRSAFILRCNSEGKGIWAKVLKSNKGTKISSAEITPDGFILVTGSYDADATFGKNCQLKGKGAFLCKLDSNGEVVWSHSSEGGIFGGDIKYTIKDGITWLGVNKKDDKHHTWLKKLSFEDGKEIWSVKNDQIFLHDRSDRSQLQLCAFADANPVVIQLEANNNRKELVVYSFDKKTGKQLYRKVLLSSNSLKNTGAGVKENNMLTLTDLQLFGGVLFAAGNFGEKEMTVHLKNENKTIQSMGSSDMWVLRLTNTLDIDQFNVYGGKYTDNLLYISKHYNKIEIGGGYRQQTLVGDSLLTTNKKLVVPFSAPICDAPSYKSKGITIIDIATEITTTDLTTGITTKTTTYNLNAGKEKSKVKESLKIEEEVKTEEELIEKTTLVVYPNPISNQSQIHLKYNFLPSNYYEVFIYSQSTLESVRLGSFLYSELQHEWSSPFIGFAKGTYFIKLFSDGEVIENYRIMVK